ncbi:glycosyltransferase, partial [Chloroflexota bacterium]
PEDKPIFISFGSAGWNEQDDNPLLQLLFSAVSMVNTRAVIVTSGDTERNNIPRNVHLINDVPHDWMFPHVSCVVHHCGLGTTAAVLKSGIPSIPVPHVVDQFAWAKRIHTLGVATEPISRRQLTVEKLALAITEATKNPTIRMNARNLAMKLHEENGLNNAVEAIENVMRTNRI